MQRSRSRLEAVALSTGRNLAENVMQRIVSLATVREPRDDGPHYAKDLPFT